MGWVVKEKKEIKRCRVEGKGGGGYFLREKRAIFLNVYSLPSNVVQFLQAREYLSKNRLFQKFWAKWVRSLPAKTSHRQTTLSWPDGGDRIRARSRFFLEIILELMWFWDQKRKSIVFFFFFHFGKQQFVSWRICTSRSFLCCLLDEYNCIGQTNCSLLHSFLYTPLH